MVAYRYVRHRCVDPDSHYSAVFMTVTQVTGWWFWKRATEIEVFKERAGIRWRRMPTGVEYEFWTSVLFDDFLRGAEARAEYEQLLDKEIAAADNNVVPIRKAK